ncbi:MAG: hypothetical protein ABFD52_09110 [Acidobacteriota bacterium]
MKKTAPVLLLALALSAQTRSGRVLALGIIGARGNNGVGVAGINWDVSLMLLKIGARGIGRNEKEALRPGRAARAIRYAADNSARVINWSGFVSGATPEDLAELRIAIACAGSKEAPGVAALALSVEPRLGAAALEKIPMDTARRLPGLEARVGCGGIVDACRAVLAARSGR